MTLGLMMRYGLMYVGASLHESVCRGRSRERSVDPPYIQVLGITVDQPGVGCERPSALELHGLKAINHHEG